MIHAGGMILHRVAGAASVGVSLGTFITDHFFVDELCTARSHTHSTPI